MKVEKIPALIGLVLIILLAFLIIWQAGIFGVSRDRLEQDARERQNIAGSWEMAQDVNEDVCAMLFYDDVRENYTYSIYLTKEGLSYGYFFRQGGTDAYMEEGVKGVVFEDKGIALLSLNEDKVCKIVVDSNADQKTIQVNAEEPFAVVLPIECGAITMYDAQGNIVTLYDTFTGA
ncbi:hypothetical protein [Acetatifactor aquisgranensis]|uniref:hypothetical protein n=1 Tax=Acetatifactor aquisgranensis TaxID=2941233 RepID=UPI00203C5E40|nr:hypothetical protein [Acetatifactor aquisgranensis]MCI8541708.1 hypothetical protein [Lachnospiraceae bacterium]